VGRTDASTSAGSAVGLAIQLSTVTHDLAILVDADQGRDAIGKLTERTYEEAVLLTAAAGLAQSAELNEVPLSMGFSREMFESAIDPRI
jgi:hypothetical protein